MPVHWYPDELAWWMTTPKNVIRKFPPFAAFQKFLVSETSVGNISRQEVVSMIPPLLMDLRPGMTVLDMCAAPGSKAAQLLEMIHIGEEARVRKVLRSFAQEDGLELGPETQDEKDANLEADPSDSGRATGLLIANDSDYKRGHMLVHQLKRLSSPNLLVMNHDATHFPSIRLPTDDPKSNKVHYLKFDRILADVPCSGDGTLRKNANLWRDWQPGNALGMHVTQVRILVRALQLLKVGGRVVYSTCSMNPVENESVIASAVERCGGTNNVEVVDCSNELPGLKRTEGLKSWKIMDKAARIWSSWEEVSKFAEESNEGVIPGRVLQTMFPPPADSNCAELPLDRCMRVYPHFQDTGAFFITVLEKRTDFKARNENEPKQQVDKADAAKETGTSTPKAEPQRAEASEAPEDTKDEVSMDDASTAGSKRALDIDEAEDQPSKRIKAEEHRIKVEEPGIKAEEPRIKAEEPRIKVEEPGIKAEEPPATTAQPTKAPIAQQQSQVAARPRQLAQGEEPFKFLDPSHPVIQNIKDFYHLSPRFPDDRYMVRNESGEPAKAVYYTSALARDILTENEGRGVKFIHGGVRMYMKQDAPSAEVCRWRIQSEGMPILQGYVGETRVIHLHSKETFRKLLIEMFPRIANGEHKNFDEIGERVLDIGMGCCVLKIEPSGDDPDFSERMALPLWKSIHSLNLMLPKEDRAAMLLRVFNDTSPLINVPLHKNRVKAESEQQQQPQQQEVVEASHDTESHQEEEEACAPATSEVVSTQE